MQMVGPLEIQEPYRPDSKLRCHPLDGLLCRCALMCPCAGTPVKAPYCRFDRHAHPPQDHLYTADCSRLTMAPTLAVWWAPERILCMGPAKPHRYALRRRAVGAR